MTQIDARMAEEIIKEKWPYAHCAPYANANYPQFYCIRGERKEWSLTLGEGPTPGAAWISAVEAMKEKAE